MSVFYHSIYNIDTATLVDINVGFVGFGLIGLVGLIGLIGSKKVI